MKYYAKISNYFNFRFGRTNDEATGDFIDNIVGQHNIAIAEAEDDKGDVYLVMYSQDKFFPSKNTSVSDHLDWLAEGLVDLMPLNVGKGLIQSAIIFNQSEIFKQSSEYKDSFFKVRDDESVSDFSPCFFVVSSLSYHCNDTTIDIETGKILSFGHKLENLSDYYGFPDEDIWFALGVMDH